MKSPVDPAHPALDMSSFAADLKEATKSRGFGERIAAATKLKEEGNAALNNGDYEEALQRYSAGLEQVTFHERALKMTKLPEADMQQLNELRLPLLLNAVLCDLRMNPEEQTRRLVKAEERCAEVLSMDPGNAKALFRRALLHGRAGEDEQAKAMLERLCRQQPNERAFRTELVTVNARMRRAQQATAAFWSDAGQKSEEAFKREDLEGGGQGGSDGAGDADGGGALFAPLLRGVLLLWQLMCQLCAQAWRAVGGSTRRTDRDL